MARARAGKTTQDIKLVRESTDSQLNQSEGLVICSGNVVKGPLIPMHRFEIGRRNSVSERAPRC